MAPPPLRFDTEALLLDTRRRVIFRDQSNQIELTRPRPYGIFRGPTVSTSGLKESAASSGKFPVVPQMRGCVIEQYSCVLSAVARGRAQ